MHANLRTIAIVGASADRAKFGNKAVRAYVRQGFTVWPVNLKETTIEGLPGISHSRRPAGPSPSDQSLSAACRGAARAAGDCRARM
jgi:hypothetical protein